MVFSAQNHTNLPFCCTRGTYSWWQVAMEFPCSQTLQSNRIYSPSISWRSSLTWSELCCQLQTKSRSLSALWSRQGSNLTRKLQSSRSPCTSPQSCNPCLPLRWEPIWRTGRSFWTVERSSQTDGWCLCTWSHVLPWPILWRSVISHVCCQYVTWTASMAFVLCSFELFFCSWFFWNTDYTTEWQQKVVLRTLLM